MNWSLWLEVSHYVLLPLLYWLGKRVLDDFSANLVNLVMVQVNARFEEHEECDLRLEKRIRAIEARLESNTGKLERIEAIVTSKPPTKGAHR